MIARRGSPVPSKSSRARPSCPLSAPTWGGGASATGAVASSAGPNGRVSAFARTLIDPRTINHSNAASAITAAMAPTTNASRDAVSAPAGDSSRCVPDPSPPGREPRSIDGEAMGVGCIERFARCSDRVVVTRGPEPADRLARRIRHTDAATSRTRVTLARVVAASSPCRPIMVIDAQGISSSSQRVATRYCARAIQSPRGRYRLSGANRHPLDAVHEVRADPLDGSRELDRLQAG